jgi:TetR/AcrR family transcriptional repressor of nem operon
MADRRHFNDKEVVNAAKLVFWQRGYAGTAIDDLQVATGLSRSSLYLAFGTKRAVFDAALAEYVTSFVDPRLGPLEAQGAGLGDAAGYFGGLAEYFGSPGASRGCLYINAIAELAGRDPTFAPAATEFTNRVRAAFRHALGDGAAGGTIDSANLSQRAAMLTAALLGVWLDVRVDAAIAAAACVEIAKEISSWGQKPATNQ